LYVCFNRPLADRFREVARPEGTADTFYGLIHHFLKSVGEKVDFDQVNGADGAFWQGLQERVIASEIPDDARYDLVIVDEGQDFSTDWYQLLLLFARPEYDLLWLEDDAQVCPACASCDGSSDRTVVAISSSGGSIRYPQN